MTEKDLALKALLDQHDLDPAVALFVGGCEPWVCACCYRSFEHVSELAEHVAEHDIPCP